MMNNRVIVTIRTDANSRGTLFELNSDTDCKSLIHQVLKDVEFFGGEQDIPSDSSSYRFVKINKPVIDIKDNQTLGQAGIENGDALLICPNDYVHRWEDFFEFDPLTLPILDELSPQELRAPMKMHPRWQGHELVKTHQDGAQENVIFTESETTPDVEDLTPSLSPAHDKERSSDVPKDWKEVDFSADDID